MSSNEVSVVLVHGAWADVIDRVRAHLGLHPLGHEALVGLDDHAILPCQEKPGPAIVTAPAVVVDVVREAIAVVGAERAA